MVDLQSLTDLSIPLPVLYRTAYNRKREVLKKALATCKMLAEYNYSLQD